MLLLLTERHTSTSPRCPPFPAGALGSRSGDGGGTDGSREGRWSSARGLLECAPSHRCEHTQLRRKETPGAPRGVSCSDPSSGGAAGGGFAVAQQCSVAPCSSVLCARPWRRSVCKQLRAAFPAGNLPGSSRSCASPVGLSSVSSGPAPLLGRAACACCHSAMDSPAVTPPWTVLGATSPWITLVSHPHGQLWHLPRAGLRPPAPASSPRIADSSGTTAAAPQCHQWR